tara:strand:+ start:813 stop:1862 length:1050 start_codon:yes stop_codon:yes gene_type:complete
MALQSKKLIIMVGIAGSGKTTYAQNILREFYASDEESYEADKYPLLYEEAFNYKLLDEAHKWCQSLVEKDMKDNKPLIIQSNTNLNYKDTIFYLELCIKYNYDVEFILPQFGLLHYENYDTKNKQIEILKNTRCFTKDTKKLSAKNMNNMVRKFNVMKKIIHQKIDEYNPNLWLEYFKSLEKKDFGNIKRIDFFTKIFEPKQHIHTSKMDIIFDDSIEEDKDALSNNPIWMGYLLETEDREYITKEIKRHFSDIDFKKEFHITTHFNRNGIIQKFFEKRETLPKMQFIIKDIISSEDQNLICAIISPLFFEEGEFKFFDERVPHITLYADRKKYKPVDANDLCKEYYKK